VNRQITDDGVLFGPRFLYGQEREVIWGFGVGVRPRPDGSLDFPGGALSGPDAFLLMFCEIKLDYPQNYEHGQGAKKAPHQDAELELSHK